jgi:hypothetical protein
VYPGYPNYMSLANVLNSGDNSKNKGQRRPTKSKKDKQYTQVFEEQAGSLDESWSTVQDGLIHYHNSGYPNLSIHYPT